MSLELEIQEFVSSQLEESLESPFLVVLALSLRHDSIKIEICLMPNSYRPKKVWKCRKFQSSVTSKTYRDNLILLQFVTRWFR